MQGCAGEKATNALKILVLCLVLASSCVSRAQDAKSLVKQAVNTELAADATDHTCWISYEVDRKPGDGVVQWVAQTHQGDVNRVLVRNGQRISESQQKQSVESFIHDSSAQAKQRQAAQRDDDQATRMLKLLPQAFLWTQTSKNEQTTTYHFKPDPNFQPPDRQARVFSAMEGDLMVDNQQHRIQEIKGQLVHDVNFGWGILGRLYHGGTFQVDRRQVAPGLWDITESHIHISGHALIFKTISEQEDDVKTQWQREPDNVTLQQAARAVMQKPDGRGESAGQ
jgi:hypothetical protein